MAKRTRTSGNTSAGGMAPLIKQVKLVDLRLVGSRTALSVPDTPFPHDVEQIKHLQQKINIETAVGKMGNRDHILCILTFIITVDPEQLPDANQHPTFQVEAAFAVAYSFDSLEGISPEQITEFGQRNALYNVWPYWREFVQSTTTRMGLPPLKIPLLTPAGLKFTAGPQQQTGAKASPGKKSRKRSKKKRGASA
jgi:preprotein translocase subunit SecB